MKKQLQLFTVLTAFMSLAGIKAMAHDIEAVNGDGVTIYYTWINNNTELAVTYYRDYYPPSSSFRYKGNVVIPESVTYDGTSYNVAAIGEYAFEACNNLTVTIGSNITSIGKRAFYASDLTSLTIPNSVTSISTSAFEFCADLTSLFIPKSVVSIGEGTFQNCRSLTSITIGSNVASIGSYAFGYCTAMKELISHATTPPTCGSRVFDGIDKKNCTLYVPVGSSTAYHDADQWKDFSMEEKTFTGIDEKPVHQEATVRKCYTIGGIHTLQPQHGLSIVRMNDGTIKKVVRK